jgi:hypothetical protein
MRIMMHPESTQANVKLRRGRVALACVLSAGLYIFYWFYITWKQLKVTTNDRHYPLWHTLALLVPIYGLFVLYRHLDTIKRLQDIAEIKPTINPGRLLILFIIAGVLQFRWNLTWDIIGLLLLALFLIATQSNLNVYWEYIHGTKLREARIGVGEIVIVLLGLTVWATYLL